MLKRTLICLLTVTTFGLVGCGGSDTPDNEVPQQTQNNSPQVTVSSTSINENQAVTLSANATDSDGSIASYSWSVISEQDIELSDANSQDVSFVAPTVSEDGVVNLQITVTDDDGATNTANVDVSIINVLPTISFDAASLNERETLAIGSSISGNGDEIDSITWEVDDESVTLNNASTATVEFIAPDLTEDKSVSLSLTVVDSDGDSVSVTNTIDMKRITLPLSISGLATDSPIKNAKITAGVDGNIIDAQTTANENGYYTLDLVLDESNKNAPITLIANGVEDQANAGLISYLGDIDYLSAMAGSDNVLTEDELFSVNITNITTAEYALVKNASEDSVIDSLQEYSSLKRGLDFNDVLSLATAIKVAIDKSGANPDLLLPEGIDNTLDLISDIEVAQTYTKQVADTSEFIEAQQEILADDKLFDSVSEFVMPEKYYVIDHGIIYFNQDGTGLSQAGKFTWQNSEGAITLTYTEPNKVMATDVMTNDEGRTYQVEVEIFTTSEVFRRLNGDEHQDTFSITQQQVKNYIEPQYNDTEETIHTTSVAVRPSGVSAINLVSGDVYLPFYYEESEFSDNDGVSSLTIRSAHITLLQGGSGSINQLNLYVNWLINQQGQLEIHIPSRNEKIVHTHIGEKSAHSIFAYEHYESDELKLTEMRNDIGNILEDELEWDFDNIPGIYDYERALFDDSLSQFFFVLHDNGDADTISASDYNNNGEIDDNEVSVMTGSWMLQDNSTIKITRFRNTEFRIDTSCREESSNCILWHQRNWTLTGISGDKIALFHRNDFPSGLLGNDSNWISDDNREIFKRNDLPIEYTISSQNVVNNQALSVRQSDAHK